MCIRDRDHPVRLAALVDVRADHGVELLAQLHHLLVADHRPALGGQLQQVGLGVRLLAAVRDLPGLPLLQQHLHLVRLQQPRNPEVVLLLLAPGVGLHAELGAVVEDPVEDGVGLQRLERQHVLLAGVLVLLLVRLLHLLLGFGVRVLLALLLRLVEGVVPLLLHLVGEGQQVGHGRQEHGRGLAAPPGPYETPDGLREEQRGGDGGGVHAHREPRHVDALGHHPHRDHPAVLAPAELVDPLRGAGVVGQDQGGPGAGDLADELGVGAGGVLVGGDDERSGVRDALPDLGQPLVGGAQHARHPLAARVEGGAPGLADRVLGHRLAEPGGDLVARLGAPAHVAAVAEEDHRPDYVVGERVAVPVRVIGGGAPDPVRPLLVRDEGDGVGVGPERRTGQREPPGRGLERLQARLAPGLGVAGVVDLVEDDQGLALLDAVAVQHRTHADTRVGDRDPVVLPAERAGAVLGVELDPHSGRGLRPLLLQVLGRRDHGDLLHDVVVQQPGGEGQREGRLAGAGRGDREEVTRLLLDVLLHRPLLPGTQLAGGTPGRSAREGGGKVVGGGSGGGSHGLRGQGVDSKVPRVARRSGW